MELLPDRGQDWPANQERVWAGDRAGTSQRSKATARWCSCPEQFDAHRNQISSWKDQLLEGAAEVFSTSSSARPSTPKVDIKALHAKIGELTLENDFLESALDKARLLSARR